MKEQTYPNIAKLARWLESALGWLFVTIVIVFWLAATGVFFAFFFLVLRSMA